jgi:ActR/RegA family two-component response regulator
MFERPYIVIVDDDKEWCKAVRQELLDKQVAGVATYQNNDEAVRAIAHNPPVHLLIDYCLCEKQENWNFLSRLQEQGMSTSNDKKDCNIWVVSDYPSLDITPLKKRFPAVHRFWFAKPLKSVEDILTKFELVKQTRNLSG